MLRRDLLGLFPTLGVLACTQEPAMSTPTTPAPSRMPVLFVAHGAPMLLEEPGWIAELGRWGAALPRPTAILIVSAHWESRPLTIGATTARPLIYDFSGFPEHYYRMTYASPGAPALAERVRGLLRGHGITFTDAPARGLDHGSYVPLMCMYPDASVPVLQISMPSLDPAELVAMGRALAPLRDEGVLIVGSGFLTHNLRAMRSGSTPEWAAEFDAWTADVLARRDLDALLDYRARAPGVALAHPTHEHFAPVLVSVGAALDETPTFPIDGWWFGSFTRRSVQLG